MSTRCLVPNCENHDDQGNGFWLDSYELRRSMWICAPCYLFLITNEGDYSQLYRNAITKYKETDDNAK